MGVSDTPADLTPLIGILGRAGEPSDIARSKQEMIDEAFGEQFDRKLRDRGVVE